jgi:acetyltransferase EpsM
MTGPRRLVLIGGGENARVLAEAARTRPERWRVAGYLDPQADGAAAERVGAPWLGSDAAAERLAAEPDLWFVLAVAGTRPEPRRRRLVERYDALGVRWAAVVHARAELSPSVVVGPGVVVYAGAVVNGGARLGAHALVGSGAVVEHDVVLGELVQLGPGAVVGGGVTVEPEAFLGLGCRVRDHLLVGRGALVGMGAVLVADAPAGAVLAGVPARPLRQPPC